MAVVLLPGVHFPASPPPTQEDSPGIVWEEERAGAGGRLRQGICGLIAGSWGGQRIRKEAVE